MVRFEDDGGGSDDRIAPVIPLFGEAPTKPVETRRASRKAIQTEWHPTWTAEPQDEAEQTASGRRAGSTAFGDSDAVNGSDGPGSTRDAAEKKLLRRLRTRSLSVREARAVVVEQGMEGDAVDDVLDQFLRRGYLDDAALADQLVHAGVDRKGHGRHVIAQTLAKRGIPRDIADAALAALHDDEEARALEFALSKARSLSSLDHDTALRRLIGQLVRRGYSGSLALRVAKEALTRSGSSGSSVQFR